MIELDQLNKFLEAEDLELKKTEDSLILDISIDDISGSQHFFNVISFLKVHRAQFEALVINKSDSDLNLKYFFYTGIQSKLLIINLIISSGLSAPSISFHYPASNSYEDEAIKKYGIQFTEKISEIIFDPSPEYGTDETNCTELPVGPIHAGVIEPGHFHFTCHGEHINRLEISFGYLHKNIEAEFENRSLEEGLELVQHICGDSITAYSLAYAQAAEKILKLNTSKSVQYTRVILLELERLYNHFSDLGGIINDTGFSLSNSFLSALKERILRLNEEFFGHRFLRNNIKLGEVNKTLSPEESKKLEYELKEIQHNFNKTLELTHKHKTVLDRLCKTGFLSKHTAEDLSVTGIVGKASGISFDSRRDINSDIYEDLNFHSHLRKEGDVYARFNVRVDEVKESFRLIHRSIEKLKASDSNSAPKTADYGLSTWSIAEAARGPIFIYIETNTEKIITKIKIRDVSKHNWKALEYAVLKNIVPDFPLCNKSFSLAYAGTDL